MPDGHTLGVRSEDDLMALHFASVWVEYQSLDATARAGALTGLPKRVIDAVAHMDTDPAAGKDLAWSDVAAVRIRVLDQSPVEALRVRAPAIRAELRSLMGDAGYRRLHPSVLDERAVARDPLLAELRQMITMIGQVAGQGMNNDAFRKGIATWMLSKAALFGGAGLMLAMIFLGWNEGWPWVQEHLPVMGTALLAAISGMAGAYVSAQRRMQPLDIQSASFSSWFALRQHYNTTKYALALGAVFAVLWWLLMIGEVVTSPLLPAFAELVPLGAKSWALFVIWSFVSGFAERLVLDVLDRFAQSKPGGNASSN